MNRKMIWSVRVFSLALVAMALAGFSTAFGQEKPASAALARDKSTNSGGSNAAAQGPGDLIAWCRGSQAKLDQARGFAEQAIGLRGDFDTGIKILVQGLQTAAADEQVKPVEALQNSLTYRAITRGLELQTAVDSVLDNRPERNQTMAVFLFRYYSFINFVANQIDIDLYIPYRNHRDYDAALFEKRYVEYAREELRWALDVLTVTDSEWPSACGANLPSLIVPRVPMKVYTTVLEFIASYAASDLSDSLWSARFACPIESLQTLQKTLHDINGGNNPYVGVQGTFAETYKEARAIADKISCGCGRQ